MNFVFNCFYETNIFLICYNNGVIYEDIYIKGNKIEFQDITVLQINIQWMNLCGN